MLFGCKWRVIDIENLDNEVMDESIRKMYEEVKGFIEYDYERIEKTKAFIDVRTKFINEEWPKSIKPHNEEVKNSIWFEPINNEEIFEAFKIEEFFTCIILGKGDDYKNYKYCIHRFETEDGIGLQINSNADKVLEDDIIHNIMRLFPEMLKDL